MPVLSELFKQSLFILSLLWPTALLLFYSLIVFYLGRFSGKYQEQKDIVRNMPQPFVNEVRERDDIIAALTVERDDLLRENIDHRATMKATQSLARKIEGRARRSEIKVLPLESRPITVKAITK